MVVVKRALLSCYDKTGLEAFAKALAALGVELIASGGTAEALAKAGLRVKTVEAFAGITQQLDGRVKTLHPKIHAGILARRDDPAHVKAVGPEGLIDLVVVNLYPFREVTQRPQTGLDVALEHIDIGGVALLRGAAKNFPHVAVVSDPAQYPTVLAALREGQGQLPEALSRTLAAEAFSLTSRYDAWITGFLGRGTEGAGLPETLSLQARKRQALRYGENPHQRGAWYVSAVGPAEHLADVTQLQGKELSYNNLLDLDAVVRCVTDLDDPTQAACVIVKHASPCGLARAATALEAYRKAHAGDPESAFGGIVAVNRPIDETLATALTETFLELVVAPRVEPAAKAGFARKANLRVLELRNAPQPSWQWRSLLGGWLIQEEDVEAEPRQPRVVTQRQPTPQQRRDLAFAWIAAKHVRSNAIVLAKEEATVGIGQGQPSRVRAVRLAIQQAGDRARGAVLASDGFFPFPDSVTLAAQAGVTALMQPGGSVKDQDVIAAADQAGLAMVFTGIRHFRH